MLNVKLCLQTVLLKGLTSYVIDSGWATACLTYCSVCACVCVSGGSWDDAHRDGGTLEVETGSVEEKRRECSLCFFLSFSAPRFAKAMLAHFQFSQKRS